MRVALGVGGGIAAYKAAELARALGERGCTVEVVMTEAAREFIQPLTFASLTGRKVITGLWAVRTARVRVFSVAPSSTFASRRITNSSSSPLPPPIYLPSFAHGLADDFLTTLYLAFTGTGRACPGHEYEHVAASRDAGATCGSSAERGHVIFDPDSGLLACGVVGPGRLAGTPDHRGCSDGKCRRQHADDLDGRNRC